MMNAEPALRNHGRGVVQLHDPITDWNSQDHTGLVRSFFARRFVILCLILVAWPFCIHARDYDSIVVLIEQYEYQQAIELIHEIPAGDDDLRLTALEAAALKGLNRYLEAIPRYELLYRNDSSNMQTCINLANCYKSAGDYQNARRVYRSALMTKPHNNYLYLQMADACYRAEDFRAAIQNYRTAYRNDSAFYLSKQLARCYDMLKITDTAIYFYHRSFQQNPIDFQTAYRLAGLYKQQEEYDAALDIARSYLVHDSNQVSMLRLQGHLNVLKEEYEEAIRSFKKCVSLGDTSFFTNKYLGYSYFKTDQYEEAADYLEKAYQRDTLDVELCYALGLSCANSVYKEAGIHYLGKTLKLVTPSPEFLSMVYQDLAAANTGYYKYREAEQAYLKAYALNPNDTLLIFRIASHYDNWIKDKKKAMKYYKIFMETRPKGNKELPKKVATSDGIVLSYYDFVLRRMLEIEEELFWQGESIE